MIDRQQRSSGTITNTQNKQNNTSKDNLQWWPLCWEGKAHGRFLSAIRVMNACSGGVRDGFIPAHLHFLQRLTDGQRRQSRRKSQNQTPAMETRLRLRCVCVLALIILKGKVTRKSYKSFFLPNWQMNPVRLQLAGERKWRQCRSNFKRWVPLMLVSNSKRKTTTLSKSGTAQRWGEKVLN